MLPLKDWDWKNFAFSFDDREIVIEEQLTEWDDERMAQRHVLALARSESPRGNADIMLKIRLDLDPKEFDIEDVEKNKETSKRHAMFEIDLFERLGNAGYGPKYADHRVWVQVQDGPCPGGLFYVTVMRPVPGQNVDEIRDQLSKSQLLSIRKQLALILENMRKFGMVMDEEDPEFLRYDMENDKLYLFDVTRFAFDDLQDPITERSAFVYAWRLWDDIESDEEEEELDEGEEESEGVEGQIELPVRSSREDRENPPDRRMNVQSQGRSKGGFSMGVSRFGLGGEGLPKLIVA